MQRGKVTALVLAASLSACSGGERGSQGASPLRSEGASVAAPAASASSPQPLTGSGDGLTLTVQLEGAEVAPGKTLEARIRVRNDGALPFQATEGCAVTASWIVKVPVPVDPPGRSWSGTQGALKAYALANGMQPGIVDWRLPYETRARGIGCLRGPDALRPGQTSETTLTWTAELLPGIPAAPGRIDFTVSANYKDPTVVPTPFPTPRPGEIGSTRTDLYKGIVVQGSLHVVGPTEPLLSGGQALDGLLADPRFATSLGAMPATTWGEVNLSLQHADQPIGLTPKGTSWSIQLFREVHVKRNWAIAFVDAHSGAVSGLTICDIPCNK